jgi:hypothetical protein
MPACGPCLVGCWTSALTCASWTPATTSKEEQQQQQSLSSDSNLRAWGVSLTVTTRQQRDRRRGS